MVGDDAYSDCQWRQQLDELVVQSELRIIEAEHRIEDHLKLWPLVAADCFERRVHLDLERNLLEGLKLLHTWRAMLLHELRGKKVPRSTALSTPRSQSGSQAHLAAVIAWLDELPTTRVSEVIAGQRNRANQELWQIQKQQLWGRVS
jgi:hypothetical protein